MRFQNGLVVCIMQVTAHPCMDYCWSGALQAFKRVYPHITPILPLSIVRYRQIRTVRRSDTSWYLTSQVQYPPTALLTFTFYVHVSLITSSIWLLHSTTYVHVPQCSIVCDPSTEYSEKLSIISVLLWFVHHLNNCFKKKVENRFIQTRHGELPVDIRLHC